MTSQTPEVKEIEEVIAEFLKKTDPDNYETEDRHLIDNGESLLNPMWYPENPFELDRESIADWLRTTLLSQQQKHREELQKARQDWLQEEIVRLEGMKKALRPSVWIGYFELIDWHYEGYNLALQTIIDRYQAELNQDNK